MDLAEALLVGSTPGSAASFSLFAQSLDQAWVEQALQATGTATVRRRKLPAEYVIWLVIGMAMLRDRSIAEVVRHLNLVMPTPQGKRLQVSGGAVVQARDRLGPEPLAWLFGATAATWTSASADEHRWRGLAVLGADGSTLRVPDSPENEAYFGRPGTSRGGAGAGYPQLRLVALMVLRSHLLMDVAVAPYRGSSELALAERLWPRVPERSLMILDRGFATYEIFHTLAKPEQQRYWLTRARQGKTATALRPIQQLGPADALVELHLGRSTRKLAPEMPETLTVRAVHYQRPGFRPEILLTSPLDPIAYPAAEIIALYHERRELEVAFDEIKTHTLEREEASLRCKTPERVTQELWGLQETALRLLPPRRSRTYPRAVKIKMSNYPRKRPVPPGSGLK